MKRRLALLCIAPWLAASVQAQCPSWRPDFYPSGASAEIWDFAVYDDGFDEALFAVGEFGAVGGAAAVGIARWDGEAWRPVGGGIGFGNNQEPDVLRVVDTGVGPRLLVLGEFTSAGGQPANCVAAWDGAQWDTFGGSPPVDPLENLELFDAEAFDSGNGLELFIGGRTFQGYEGWSPYLAKWDGSSWTRITDGPGQPICFEENFNPCPLARVSAFEVFDYGSGPRLVAGGLFETVGGAPAAGLAEFDGTTWLPVAGTGGASVKEMLVHDDGNGAQLYVSGGFGGSVAITLRSWNGSVLSTPGGASTVPVNFYRMRVLDAVPGLPAGLWVMPSGPATQTGLLRLVHWDGAQWTEVQVQMAYPGSTYALQDYDSGDGNELVVGGRFPRASVGVAGQNVARWNGNTGWAAIGATGQGLDTQFSGASFVKGLVVHDVGDGPALYAAGEITWSAGQQLTNLVRWDGGSWSPIGNFVLPYLHEIVELESVDFGSGPELWAAGDLKVANNNPGAFARWTPTGGTTQFFTSSVGVALQEYDSGNGTRLYLAMRNRMYEHDGSTFEVMGGLNSIGAGRYRALTTHDDGTGLKLYAAGRFETIEGVAATNVAAWDGTTWIPIGEGLEETSFNGGVFALLSFDDGTGSKLYAGGSFTSSGATPIANLAVWDGMTWSEVGGGVTGSGDQVLALEAFDDGRGDGRVLFVAGELTEVDGGTAVHGLARFDGTAWDATDLAIGGPRPIVNELLAVPSAEVSGFSGRALVLGGDFDSAGTVPGQRIASLVACDTLGESYCVANANSVSATGAAIAAFGSASISGNDLLLACEPVAPGEPGVFFYGGLRTLNPQGFPFGEGQRCVAGALTRLLPATYANAAGRLTKAVDNTLPVQAAGLIAGMTQHFQGWYRDPAAGDIDGDGVDEGFNLTDALTVRFEP